MSFAKMKCEACRPDAPKATEAEIREYQSGIPDWEVVWEENVQKLKRSFQFPKYGDSLAFVNAVAEVAEEEGHHPVMLFEFRKVTVFWWSHKIGGLHVNDFIMAARTDGARTSLEVNP